MDICARAPLIAEKMLHDQKLENARQQRCSDWNEGLGTQILQGELSMAELASLVHGKNINPQPRPGHQEYLENMVSTYLL